ncbi:MAG: Asp-tRNA(Asn)/Glu-tRNA(Gln) amidotransferase subunit GatC [Candidatus Pacebacteria bacterium]|nr:Asp-tRNA(Asn)/Glu-tRNA(Gln) amidotransferase subunit GatC [Candidatus Paceibacterota bacterium]
MDISHILKLSKLELNKKEKAKMEKEFSNILDFVNKLQEVDIKKEELSEEIKNSNIFREDEVVQVSEKQKKLLRDSALNLKDGYFKIKKIL